MPAILEAAAEAGARTAFYTMLRLPLGVAGIFSEWLDRNAPLAKEKVLGRLRGMRDGRLNDARFGHRMGGDGAHADLIRTLFKTSVARVGLDKPFPELSTARFRRPGQVQLSLFD